MIIESTEIWRQIPPEEKFELMSRAHAKGVTAAVITIIICSTIAVGLQLGWVMWASFAICPFVFQFAAGKEWRGLRPRIMLEYLAARSAARRYAFTANGKDLSLSFMFRGHFERLFDEDRAQEALEAAIEKTKEAEVWVALFADSIILMSEQPGGARLEFSSLLSPDRIQVTANSSDNKDYSSYKELVLASLHKNDRRKVKLTSKYPAALIVFEKKLKTLIEAQKGLAVKDAAEALALEAGEDSENNYNLY
jgi:hypothetical protein